MLCEGTQELARAFLLTVGRTLPGTTPNSRPSLRGCGAETAAIEQFIWSHHFIYRAADAIKSLHRAGETSAER
jgi:hypothetical protein